MPAALDSALRRLGVPDEGFVDFGNSPTARHLRYMDLLPGAGRRVPPTDAALPEGVIEVSGKAALYVIRQELLAGPLERQRLAQLMRTVACRADAAYLAVVNPASCYVYRVGFYADGELPAVDSIVEGDNAIGLRDLLNSPDEDTRPGDANRTWLDDLLFKLLTNSAQALRDACKPEQLSNDEVLSLVGRALFTRFLVDRGILRAADLPSIFPGARQPEQLFESPSALTRTFAWLDEVFNGNLLELHTQNYADLMAALGPAADKVCRVLSNVMVRSDDGQLSLDWEGLRFQHIPVDVLSQVYEHFAHRYMPTTAKKTSIHYTPRAIAEMLVDGVFSATPQEKRHSATVLDPAVGAGVFLVLAYRRLVAEHWLHKGKRPRRAAIRRILLTQLCGLDINPISIKVAALSLYLAALELDPEPQPLSDLRFECLFGTTLRCVDLEHLGGASDGELGSLSEALRSFGPFDIVLANPPWTRLAGRLKKLLDKTAYGTDEKAPRGADSLVPNQWPDLAFLWRANQWCRPNGVIGLLVHARLLFSEETAQVRARWFSITRATGILNGMHVRQDRRIWPSNSQPFCALVSINTPSQAGDSFHFLTPRNEPALGRRREFRLDPKAAIAVPMERAIHDPHAFKALSRGSALDLELIGRLRRKPRVPMHEYMLELDLHIWQGFISGENELQDASELWGMRLLEASAKPQFVVHPDQLPLIEEKYPALEFQWPRDPSIYRGPMLLFREAPKQAAAQRGALYCDGDLAFSRSFHGVTIPSNRVAEADYLFLLSYADLLAYWTLMTSSKFGVERDIYNQADFLNFPVLPLASLSSSQMARVEDLAESFKKGEPRWAKLNDLVANIYGLSRYDRDLIVDALELENPYHSSKVRALEPVPANDACVQAFADKLAAIVSEVEDVSISGTLYSVNANGDGAWQFVRLTVGELRTFNRDHVRTLLQRVSDNLMSSEIRLQLGAGDWLIGRLRQRRYWSNSQARLLALDLIEHGLFAPSGR
jgi:N-6 DNA Methylase